VHTAEPHRRQIICQLPADPRGLTITQQKRYCSRCPFVFTFAAVRLWITLAILVFALRESYRRAASATGATPT